jgi:hypothetical protein
MSDDKHTQFRPPLYNPESSRQSGTSPGKDARREQEGWDAYRKWMKSMGGKQPSRRAPIDHSVYSWKGYQNWADRVRGAFDSEDS